MLGGSGTEAPCPGCGAALSEGACARCGPVTDLGWVGRTLGGRYQLDALIGAGGWGRVYRGTHLALGEPIAVKLLRRDLTRDPSFEVRFKREAVILARLRHPGIVSVIDFGEEAGQTYMVMELVQGTPLSRLLVVDGQPLPQGRVLAILDAVLQVLEAAHAAGVVHRDIKPDNVMVLSTPDRSEHVKVLDFGLATIRDPVHGGRLTADHVVQGTPHYMSPEQCRGEVVGPPTDVYAVGAMFFELLAGEPPFDGANMTDIMIRQIHVPPPAIADRGLQRAVPLPVESLVRWALHKDPAQRPSAAQLRDAIRRVLAGTDPISAAARAHDERVAEALRPRAERGLPDASRAHTLAAAPAPDLSQGPTRAMELPPDDPSLVRTLQAPLPLGAPPAAAPTVVLWGLGDGRAQALQDALAVQGLAAARCPAGRLPAAEIGGQAVRAVVIDGGEGAEAAAQRLRELRGSEALKAVPVLAIDLPRAADAPALIRAGVSDATLTQTGDEATCQRVWRLVRRGR